MKKIIIIILAILIIFSGCSFSNNEASPSTEGTASLDETPKTSSIATTSNPTPEPTSAQEMFDFSSISPRSLNALILEYNIPEDTSQLILVAAGTICEKLYLMEKLPNNLWQVAHGPFEVQIGKNGLGKEKEGDNKSPEGIYEIGYAFGKGGAPVGTIWPWRSTTIGDIWIEDSNSTYYNMFVQEDTIDDADWKNYSNLNIAAFARALEIRYNPERTPKAGSAIFLHIWVRSSRSTSGCTAISRENIETLIAWLNPESQPLIAQVPYEALGNGDLVYLNDFSYNIISDIRFATDENIIGTALDGYNENLVITKADTAKALAQVNSLLKACDRRLVIYEAYRPLSASSQLKNWLVDKNDMSTQDTYYEDIDKYTLAVNYFRSSDNKKYTKAQIVHVGLADMQGNPVDMGGEYMVFNEYSAYNCDNLTQEQIYNRELLHDIMTQEGFSSTDNQWWKFEYIDALYPINYDEIVE